jgi:DNA-binding winged helix-turn-helix (wHTH) protein/tetratricopeptide (TPR) repeat protein
MPDEPRQHSELAEDFRVGEWLVQPSIARMTRRDTVVHLRPQLTDLLILLARRAGQTVTKETILQEVWARQFVGESGLTRCIAEIRHALNDDARHPQLLETIPKRGYRLVAPVTFLPRNPATARPEAPAGASAMVACPAPPPPALTGPPDSGPQPVGRASKANRFAGRAPWMLVRVVVVVGVVVTLAAADWRGRPMLSERNTILLADVRNSTGDPMFDDTLRLALAASLEQVPYLRILPEDAVRSALTRAGHAPSEPVLGPLALDVCRREGAAVLLAGSIARLGSRYAVGIEALACGTGESVGRAVAEANDKEHVLTALEQAAERIRLKLGESGSSLRQHDVPLVRATTSSLEALKAVTLADLNRDHARLGEALTLYRQATELDPMFALAWARRGATAWTLGLREDAIPAFRRAYELRDRVSPPEGFYIRAHYYELVAGDPAKAIESCRAWQRMYPGSVVPPTNLVSILAGNMGQYEAALPEAREAMRLAPYSSLSYGNLVQVYLGLNRIAEARQAITEAASRGVSDGLIHAHLFNLALLDGDRVALAREIRWASNDPLAALATVRQRASAAMAGGRLREARQLWSEALVKAAEIGAATRVADIRLDQAEGEALLGDPRVARVAVGAGLAQDKGATTLAGSAIVLALAGDAARARTLLDEIARQAQPDLPSPQVWLPVARALVAAGLGRADEAIGILQPVACFERGSDFRFVPLGVRAIVQRSARRPADAAAAFEAVIGLRALDPASPWVAFARLGLAQALRESGDVVRSVAAFDAFLDSWKDADPDAPLLNIARRERAALAAR